MILREERDKDKDFPKTRGISTGRDRFESASRNRLEFPSGAELSSMVNSDFARQRGGMGLQRSVLRTGHAEPQTEQEKRKENARASAAQAGKGLHLCHYDTHVLI